MPKVSFLAAGLSVIALGLAACGSSSSGSSSSTTTSAAASSSSTSTSGSGSGGVAVGGRVQTIAANPTGTLAYTKKTLTAKAGTVTFVFTNKSPLSHNLSIQRGTNGDVIGATPIFQGGTKTLKLKLAPGTYTFFCSVPGHRMAGMVGTLTVQ
jgi:plastocyanin